MGISSLVTRGFSNGTYVGSIAEIVTVGYLPDNGINFTNLPLIVTIPTLEATNISLSL